MKKYLFLLIFALPFVFSSCSKNDDPKETTYTFSYNLPGYESVSTNITIFEYNQAGEKIANNSFDIPSSGIYSKKFTANSMAEKVKVYVVMKAGTVTSNRWVQQVFYLTTGSNTDIEMTGSTKVGTSEP